MNPIDNRKYSAEDSPSELRAEASGRIKELTEAHLANGGKITEIPRGVSGDEGGKYMNKRIEVIASHKAQEQERRRILATFERQEL